MSTWRAAFLVVTVLAQLTATGCTRRSCESAGGDRVDQLILQLEGGCCQYHTNPTEEQIDNSCKSLPSGFFPPVRIFPDYSCAKWAAECLGQMGEQARPAVPALIEAIRGGPNNYDTGDGVIPARDQIVLALGRIGDERAVQPLLEALDNPRAVDAGPGAIGYASEEPQGEAAALEALGLLEPAAQPAVGRIIPYLSRPIAEPRDERIVRAAATALGRIQDVASIPVLIEALSETRRAPFVARALGEFGPKAEAAAPALIRLIEESPDGDGNALIRSAIREIRGKEALAALPKSYQGMTTDLVQLVQRIGKKQKVRLRRIHIDGPRDELAVDLETGYAIHVEFDREPWVARRVAQGRVVVKLDGSELAREEYTGVEELGHLVSMVLNEHAPAAN